MTELTHLGDAHRGSEQADLHQCHLPGRQTPLHRDGAVAAVKRADRARGANLAEHSVSPRAAAGAGCRDPIGYGSAVVGSAVLRRCGRRLAAALEYEALQGGLELWGGRSRGRSRTVLGPASRRGPPRTATAANAAGRPVRRAGGGARRTQGSSRLDRARRFTRATDSPQVPAAALGTRSAARDRTGFRCSTPLADMLMLLSI